MKTTNQFIEEAMLKHGDKYNYSLVIYTGSKNKIKIICKKHGIFEQEPRNHFYYGCKKCSHNNKLTLEDFIEKSKIKHGDKYDYSEINFINTRSNVKIICPIHGSFEQKAWSHIDGQGCSKCSYRKSNTYDFIKKANIIHNNRYKYENTIYYNLKTKVIITCEKHGDFTQNPNSHLRGSGCPKCHISTNEKIIEDYLIKINRKYKYQFYFTDLKYKNYLYFDFCIFKESGKKYKLKDKLKIDYCVKNNIKLIVINYQEDINKKLEEL
jgi:hypothetical protein